MKAFEILCRENYARIYNYIYAMTKDAFLSEDLVQDVFLIAYRKGEAFLQHEKPEAFLYRTAKNKVLEAMRQNQMLELSGQCSHRVRGVQSCTGVCAVSGWSG